MFIATSFPANLYGDLEQAERNRAPEPVGESSPPFLAPSPIVKLSVLHLFENAFHIGKPDLLMAYRIDIPIFRVVRSPSRIVEPISGKSP